MSEGKAVGPPHHHRGDRGTLSEEPHLYSKVQNYQMWVITIQQKPMGL